MTMRLSIISFAGIVRTLVAEAAERYASGAVDQVKVVYQNFVSTFEQRATLRTVFPLSLEELERVALTQKSWPVESGRQELLEHILHEQI